MLPGVQLPKWELTWEHGGSFPPPMDSLIFKDQLQGSKPIGLKKNSYHWKAFGI